MNKRLLLLSLGAIVCLGLAAHAARAAGEQRRVRAPPVRERRDVLQNHRYAEALKDLQAVVDSFATTSMADNALLQIAQYQLDVARDVARDAGVRRPAAQGLSRTPTPRRWRTCSPDGWR